jgi:hypothetical protein
MLCSTHLTSAFRVMSRVTEEPLVGVEDPGHPPADHQHPIALLQGLGQVLRLLTPHLPVHERRRPIHIPVGVAVVPTGVTAIRNPTCGLPVPVNRSSGSAVRLPAAWMEWCSGCSWRGLQVLEGLGAGPTPSGWRGCCPPTAASSRMRIFCASVSSWVDSVTAARATSGW